MAQHFLLSAGASTMSAIDALAMGDEAYIIYRFATSVRGCAAAEIADDIEWPVLKTGRYLDKLRAIMRRQTADDPVAITANVNALAVIDARSDRSSSPKSFLGW